MRDNKNYNFNLTILLVSSLVRLRRLFSISRHVLFDFHDGFSSDDIDDGEVVYYRGNMPTFFTTNYIKEPII
jgi:hypothetical protein